MNSILTNYTFDTVAKTVTLTDVPTVDVNRVRFIKNLTTNSYIYALTGSLNITASTNVITFTGSVVGMANTDVLSIQYDLPKSLDEQLSILSGSKFYFSTVNSTTAQLTAGAAFTGAIEDVTGYPSISFLAFADQDLTITISQFIDLAGTKIAEQRILSYRANEKSSISYPINGNYLRVVCTNNGVATTTNLQIDSAYGIIDTTSELNDDYMAGQSAQTAVINNILTPTASANSSDVSKFRSFTCQVVSTGTAGTFIFEGSNDGTNFQSVPVYNQALTVRVPIITAITASASQIIYEGSCNFKFLRLRIATLITGGSIRTHSVFLRVPLGTTIQTIANGTAANLLMSAAQSGTWTAQIGNTPNTTAILANPLVPLASLSGDTGAKVATGNGATLTNATGKGLMATINIGTVSGTTPTAVFKIQGSNDSGTTWLDIPSATTASITATGIYGITIYPAITTQSGIATSGSISQVNTVLPRTYRFVWTIGGTTPSFTITNIQINNLL